MVEDNDQVAVVFKEGLEEVGYQVKRVATGYDAILSVMKDSFDLISMDLILPDANGVVVALAFRGLGFTGPIIVFTGGALPISQNVYDRVGFAGRLLKPARLSEVIGEIKRHLGHLDPSSPDFKPKET